MMKYKFIGAIKYNAGQLGIAFAVKNPVECSDFSHLIGSVVEIDGVQYEVMGVEFKAHAPPWKEGEDIGLLAVLLP